MKLNAAAQAAWNQSTATSTQGQAQSYQNGTQQPQQSLHAPPGVAPPSSFSQQPTQQGQSQAQTPFVGNGNGNGNGTPTTGNGGNGVGAEAQGQSASAPAPVPQTPAQQILMSAADRWGLLGLLAMIKNADPDQALLLVGTDLGTMGLDMQQQGCAIPLSFSFLLFLPPTDIRSQESVLNIHYALG
jgi:CCR4-NOT transcription complex subunit 2